MECQRVFIKFRSHRPPGVQINVVYQQIQLSSSTQQDGCWIHSGHFTRTVLDARNSSEKDYFVNASALKLDFSAGLTWKTRARSCEPVRILQRVYKTKLC